MLFIPLNKNDMPDGFDSKEEVYFEWWLEEMLINGFIKSFKRSMKFVLVPGVRLKTLRHKPTKKEPERFIEDSRSLMLGWTYTPDYDIIWTDKGYNVIFQDIDIPNDHKLETYFYAKKTIFGYLTTIDVKPIMFRTQTTSSVKFPHIQKTMMNKYGIYVQKVCPIGRKSLFDITFTPGRFYLQDFRPKARTISQWKAIRITEFLKRKGLIDT